jgi:hypothetical protein
VWLIRVVSLLGVGAAATLYGSGHHLAAFVVVASPIALLAVIWQRVWRR